ncbi:DUF456 domain-containing protein [Anaerobacillus sp. MEB173]|uniref:DUF456 domain-containing protein n=1 Tax=Anaerobacillus sp. MEB173 TaxID=3383345 RepID=UPI003F8D9262
MLEKDKELIPCPSFVSVVTGGFMMGVLIWIVIYLLFLIGFAGIVYPIIPTIVFVLLAFVIYGLFFGITDLPLLFWFIQGFLLLALLTVDYLANLIGIKKHGGTNAAIWGSTIGLLIGPFIIPIIGIVIGPFIGAIAAELLIRRKPFVEAIRVGVGSLIGFLGGALVKGIILIVIVFYFSITVF